VCFVEGVVALGKRGEWCRGCEEEVRAEAVVGVDCVACLEGDFLFRGGRGHGEVGAGGCCDVHVDCWCVVSRSLLLARNVWC
jgi:hypothetical protein